MDKSSSGYKYRYSQLPDGRVLDCAPMAKGNPVLAFENGVWVTFKGTLGEWRHSISLTEAEARVLTVSGPDRLTPSEIEWLRQDKRDSIKRLREITKAQAASKH
jgi:hypothetical protein